MQFCSSTHRNNMKSYLQIFSILFCILLFYSKSDAQSILIKGKIVDAKTKIPLHRANVLLDHSNKGSSSNKNGEFKLKIKKLKGFTLYVSYIGYESSSVTFSEEKLIELGKDTIDLKINLKAKAVEIAPIEIVSNQDPDTIYGSKKHHISDYELLNEDSYMFLVYDKKVQKYANVVITDKDQNIQKEIVLTNGAKELFKDIEGNINIITQSKVYRLDYKSDNLSLQDIPKGDFERLIKPCIDTTENGIVFSNYQWYYPEFSYYLYKSNDSSKTEIIKIVDRKLKELFRSEYKYLSPKQKLEARKIEWKSGIEKEDAAALFISNFQNNFYYESLYAPAFVINDTIAVFDHYNDHLYLFSTNNSLLDSIPINYHKSKDLKWKEQLIQDEKTREIYSLYYKNGHYFLNKVDTKSGQLNYSFKLSYRYIENIKIKNGYVYYIYRPFESIQKKYLYREYIND